MSVPIEAETVQSVRSTGAGTVPREIFAGFNRQPWLPHDTSICTFLEFMTPIAQTVQRLPQAKLTNSLDQWRLLRDIALQIQRAYGDPFRSRIAAKSYLCRVDASTVAEDGDGPDQGLLGYM